MSATRAVGAAAVTRRVVGIDFASEVAAAVERGFESEVESEVEDVLAHH